jgi:spermidine/putrescine transport system substrate-binding protein
MAGVALGGPALLAACSGNASPVLQEVRVFNEPLAIDDNTPQLFERSSGVSLRYREYTDPVAYLGRLTPGLRAHRDVGADVIVVPDHQAAQMIEAGWVRRLPDRVAARRCLPAFANPRFDPGRAFSLPYTSTVVGLAYDTRRVHTPIRTAGALFDPRFAGKVALSADPAATLGLTMLASGQKPDAVTATQAAAAVQRVRSAVAGGQVGSFATTESIDDLVSGRALIAIARADDVRAVQPISPTIAFVVPAEGGLLVSTDMVVPVGAHNLDAAGVFIDYVFKADVGARLASYTNSVPSVVGAIDSLRAIDPKSAADPLVEPDPATWRRLAIWGGTAATDAATNDFASLVASHRGSALQG